MSAIVDADERAQAIDPLASYCVGAPAGSGKTELLIQRYLCLLGRVSRPEQVLAITFTRKAAAEMRERVVQALLDAGRGIPCESAHERRTRELAVEALEADAQGQWHLVRDVSRLNIKTIDSFCASLTRQMPVLSQLGGQIGVQDDTEELYSEAVQELFKQVDRDHPVAEDLKVLMLHFDNNWERLQELLVSMLARREQWRAYVGVHHQPEESEDYLVKTVNSLVRDELQKLEQKLTPFKSQLLDFQQYAASNLDSPIPLAFVSSDPAELYRWIELRNLLLTQNGLWRKTITKREGFPAGKGEAAVRKEQFLQLLDDLDKVDDLLPSLAAVNVLPIIEAGAHSWQLVLHLSRLLPMLAAELLLVFQKYGVVDHSQVAQSALSALGEDEAPTDLALRMDYRIEHILVDEFQDTAVNQYDLLQKLTRDWGDYNASHPDAPRTLMIVGDGMQSIYGFRGANVGLFLKARLEGFNGVALRYLQLQCNFRSDEGVVSWVNYTFAKAFPKHSDVNRAQVSYSAASAIRPALPDAAIAMHAFCGEAGREQEIAFICDQIASCVSRGDQVAVLGRSRSHLQPVISVLKENRIVFHAQDLDSLASSPVIADLLTLCRALGNNADRLAWMALLRAPWCGLQLADLLIVSGLGVHPRYTSLWTVLKEAVKPGVLSPDGNERLRHISGPLLRARAHQDRLALRVWIEQLWTGLGGPQCIAEQGGLEDAESFFQLLEEADAEGLGLDVDWLERRLEKQFMSGGDPQSLVQIMTLHKAKGLEFQRVIIPQLDKTTRADDRAILLWDEHSSGDGTRSFLLAADDRSEKNEPTLYNYLKHQRQRKSLLESTRLLYVGTTRAIGHLVLTASLKWDEKTEEPRAPAKQSLLNCIWPTFSEQMSLHHADDGQQALAARTHDLIRLGGDALQSTRQEFSALKTGEGNVPRRAENHVERTIGTTVHLAMEEISRLASVPDAPSDKDVIRWRRALQSEGLWGDPLEAALMEVLNVVRGVLRDNPCGRWILSSEHAEAHSEWSLTTVTANGGIQDIVIDRSFVDRDTGVRWVIDYKNSRPLPGESTAAFTARESETYREQLLRYRDALQSVGHEPLCCALFFTAIGQFHHLVELDLPATVS